MQPDILVKEQFKSMDKEQQEYEQLTKDIAALEIEKEELTVKMEQQLDYQELEKIGNRIREITMQEIVIIHMTDIVKGKRFEKSGLS